MELTEVTRFCFRLKFQHYATEFTQDTRLVLDLSFIIELTLVSGQFSLDFQVKLFYNGSALYRNSVVANFLFSVYTTASPGVHGLISALERVQS